MYLQLGNTVFQYTVLTPVTLSARVTKNLQLFGNYKFYEVEDFQNHISWSSMPKRLNLVSFEKKKFIYSQRKSICKTSLSTAFEIYKFNCINIVYSDLSTIQSGLQRFKNWIISQENSGVNRRHEYIWQKNMKYCTLSNNNPVCIQKLSFLQRHHYRRNLRLEQ